MEKLFKTMAPYGPNIEDCLMTFLCIYILVRQYQRFF